MVRTLPLHPLVVLISLFLPFCPLAGQCWVTSTTGYTVHATVAPQAVVPAAATCPWGYTYQTRMAYNVVIAGPSAPASLYTLQGRIGCGATNIFFDLPNNGGSGSVMSSNAWTPSTNCAGVTPAALGCSTVRLELHGPGIPSQEIICSVGALPVELLTFQATPVNDEVVLRWVTATETENVRFIVERSAGGVDFAEVVQVPGAGTSMQQQSYEVRDAFPIGGTSLYRLRHVDAGGDITYGPVIAVRRDRPRPVGIHPNPVRERFTLDGVEPGGQLEILSAAGERISAGILAGAQVPVGFLAPGFYLLRYTDAYSGAQFTERFVKE